MQVLLLNLRAENQQKLLNIEFDGHGLRNLKKVESKFVFGRADNLVVCFVTNRQLRSDRPNVR